MRRAAGPSALLSIVVAAATPLAAPAGDSFDSRVSIRVEGMGVGVPTALHGRVRSAKDACERRRKVKVVRRDQGEVTIFGRDRTDREGSWRVDPPGTVPNGTCRAVAAAKRIATGHCATARSESVFVD